MYNDEMIPFIIHERFAHEDVNFRNDCEHCRDEYGWPEDYGPNEIPENDAVDTLDGCDRCGEDVGGTYTWHYVRQDRQSDGVQHGQCCERCRDAIIGTGPDELGIRVAARHDGYTYDRFEIVSAHAHFWSDHHSGQWSGGYERLCRILDVAPGALDFSPSTGAQAIYNSLCERWRAGELTVSP